MNYRHAFHAGNHTEVFKHAALMFVLEWLGQKPAPFAVLDTHAGVGLYDLGSSEAVRTGEATEGVGRVFGHELASAPGYAQLLRALNPDGLTIYPGSPEIIRRALREHDRLMACELHPADAEALWSLYRGDARVAVHHRDGYEAIGALTPPPERRGLVFIDPPYEAKDEAAQLIRALGVGLGKWPTGTFMAWYPVKDRGIADAVAQAARTGGWPKALRAEFLTYSYDGARLAGGGLLIVGAPWKLDERLSALGAELAGLLGEGGATWRVDWLTLP